MNSAVIAKSITDSDTQTRQHKNHQAIRHNNYSAVVVDTEREEKKEIIQSLGKLGLAISRLPNSSRSTAINVWLRCSYMRKIKSVLIQQATLSALYRRTGNSGQNRKKKTTPMMMERDTSQGNMRLLSCISPNSKYSSEINSYGAITLVRGLSLLFRV